MDWRKLCSESQIEVLEQHLKMVIDINNSMNLTRIDTIEEGEILHIEDSLIGLLELNDAPDGLYGDMGTGAGYPGIPLAVVSGRETVLIDSRQKKVEALQKMVKKLKLTKQVTCYAGRAEECCKDYKGEFSVVTARALAKLSVLMELASPLLKQGGRLICYKAHISEEEMTHAQSLTRTFGMKMVSDRLETLSDKETLRRIVVFEKCGYPMIILPRHVGFAQRRPL